MGMVDDYRTMEARINDGRCLLGVAIPRDFSRKLLRGQEADVQLLFDGSDSNTASIALSYADVVVQTHSLELRNRWLEKLGGEALVMPVEPRLRVWYNHEMRSKNFIVPGLIAVILMTIAALLTSLTIAREWEMGTMEQLLSTPLRPAELVLGKMLSFFGIAVVDTVIAVLVGVCVFDVPFRGGWVFTGVTVFVFVFGSLCWGILLSALTRSQLMAFQAGMLSSFLPAFLLSGFIFDIGNMPAIVRAATYIFPTRYLVTVLKSAFLKGLGLEVLWMETVFLLLYAGLIFLLTTRKLRQKVA
jgi:ABC-2 type transport system permease protein